jgi:hypothetical protein
VDHEAERPPRSGVNSAAESLAFSQNEGLVQIGLRIAPEVLRGDQRKLHYAEFPGSGFPGERPGKLEMYRTIPSLRDYIIVSHREQRVTVHHRDDRGEWSTRVAIRAGRILVESVGATLVVDEIYRRSSIA